MRNLKDKPYCEMSHLKSYNINRKCHRNEISKLATNPKPSPLLRFFFWSSIQIFPTLNYIDQAPSKLNTKHPTELWMLYFRLTPYDNSVQPTVSNNFIPQILSTKAQVS